jgi:hypothetical protein
VVKAMRAFGGGDGCVALLLIALMVVLSWLPQKLRPTSQAAETLSVFLAIGAWASAMVFGVSGVRRGRLACRVAAGISLAFLAVQAVGTLVVAFH